MTRILFLAALAAVLTADPAAACHRHRGSVQGRQTRCHAAGGVVRAAAPVGQSVPVPKAVVWTAVAPPAAPTGAVLTAGGCATGQCATGRGGLFRR